MVDVTSFIHDRRRQIEETLHLLLPPSIAEPQPVHAAMRYSILNGGHRYRPIILLAAAEVFGQKPVNVLPVACAVEMIHTAAMILDDLPAFDDADIRHGKPACHKQYGEHIAILTSHCFLILCLDILRNHVRSPERWRSIFSSYSDLITVMIAGEAMDVYTRSQKLDVKALTAIYVGKSARLFSFAASAGAALADAEWAVQSLDEYGEHLGFAYQILDDIYDVEGGPADVGKAPGMDWKNQKATTFPLLYGIDQSRLIIEEHKQKARSALGPLGGKAALLLDLVDVVVPGSHR